MTDQPASTHQPDLYAAAYAELRRIARRERRRAGAPATINTTALVHETWFKLRPGIKAAGFTRNAFLAIAARAMRQVLVDHARKLNAQKRRHATVTLGNADADHPAGSSPVAMLELDSALCRLADIDARLARIVELHSVLAPRKLTGIRFTAGATPPGRRRRRGRSAPRGRARRA